MLVGGGLLIQGVVFCLLKQRSLRWVQQQLKLQIPSPGPEHTLRPPKSKPLNPNPKSGQTPNLNPSTLALAVGSVKI